MRNPRTYRSSVFTVFTIWVLLFAFCSGKAQSPFEYTLDPEFNTATIGKGASVGTMVVEQEGSIVIGGNFDYDYSVTTPTFRGLGRLNPDGSAGAWAGATASTMGRILPHLGDYVCTAGGRVNKFTTQGQLYQTVFGALWTSVNFGNPHFVWNIYPESQDRILVAGSMATDSLQPDAYRQLIRLMPDGTEDSTMTIIEVEPNSHHYFIHRMHWDSQGRCYVSGRFESINGHETHCIARLHPNYTVDTNFTSGLLRPWIYDSWFPPGVLGIDEQDRVWVGTTAFLHESNLNDTLQIIRYLPSGARDTSFLPKRMHFDIDHGEATLVSPIAARPRGILPIEGTDHYILYGDFSHFNDTAAGCITAIDGQGNIQPSYFQGDGVGAYTYPSVAGSGLKYPKLLDVQMLDDGSLLLAGYFGTYDGEVRYSMAKLKKHILGTENIQLSSQLRLFPNPARDEVTVHFDQGTLIRVGVFDLIGNALLSVRTHDQTVLIDVGSLSPGMYLLMATTLEGKTYSNRLIIGK